MSGFPYTTVPGKLPKLMETIGNAGVPAKADGIWLKKLGFTSSNDRSLLPVLRFIGFVDDASAPTSIWQEYRGPKSKNVLGSALENAYSDLFHTMPKADSAALDALANYFKANTTAGEQAVNKMVSTFRTLSSLAEFDVQDRPISETQEKPDEEHRQETELGKSSKSGSPSQIGVGAAPLAINVNIQLTLPATDEQAVFDAIFKSLQENILKG